MTLETFVYALIPLTLASLAYFTFGPYPEPAGAPRAGRRALRRSRPAPARPAA